MSWRVAGGVLASGEVGGTGGVLASGEVGGTGGVLASGEVGGTGGVLAPPGVYSHIIAAYAILCQFFEKKILIACCFSNI